MNSPHCPCLKSELDLFQSEFMQVSIENSSFIEIQPISGITEKSPIEFLISGSSAEKYIDPSYILFHLQAKIVKKNGSVTTDVDKVAPVNYLLNSCIANVQVFLNDKCIANDNNYPYRAYLEGTLCYSQDAQNTLLSSGLYFRDDASKYDDTDPITSTNRGFKKRYNRTKKSVLIDMIGPLHLDITGQSKLLINGIDLRIKLEQSKDAFVLMSDKDDYKLKLESASLFVRKVDISPSIILAHERALERGIIKMPIRKIDCKTFTLPSGIHSHTIANAFIGTSPTRIIIGFVLNTSYNGSFSKNPYNFVNLNLNHICLNKDGENIPSKAYTPNYDSGLYARNYLALFTDLGRYQTQQDLNITYDEYKDGLTLYAFDLTPDFSASADHISTLKNTNISIDLKFEKALPETVNVIVYSESRNVIEIDKSRNIYIDY